MLTPYSPRPTRATRRRICTLSIPSRARSLRSRFPDQGRKKYSLGDAKFEFIGPLSDHKNVNDDSLVLRLDYGDTSFLFFTGDMTAKAEKELIEDGAGYKSATCSRSGTTARPARAAISSLYEAEPKIGVISCGRDNDYGHPA